jgi:hypothetical protein
MRLLLLLALLALPLRAPAADEDTGELPGRSAGKARRMVENLPLEARVELRRMYRRYQDVVSTRLEQGWRPAVLDEADIAGEGDGEEPFKPARLIEDMIGARRRDARELRARLEKLSPEDELPLYNRTRRLLNEKTAELQDLRAKAARGKGLSRDWSDLVWHELSSMELQSWSARDAVRKARPFHTGAVVCSPPEEQAVCLVFDPWAEGKADVFAFDAWNEGAQGGRFPREYMIHGLPEKAP